MYYNFKKKAKKAGLVAAATKTENNQAQNPESIKSGTSGAFFILGAVFIACLAILYTIYLSFPKLEEHEKQHIKLPSSIDDAKHLGRILKKYNQDHFYSVLAAFFNTYVFLQTFAIPGSIFLSILSGFLFPFPLALFLVCTCTTLGAVLCYFLSQVAARKIVLKYFRSRVTSFQKKVNSLKGDLFWYIIFLRVTPIVPNWFINLTSPIIKIPLTPFVLGTFLGVAPPSLMYIQAGKTLNELVSTTSVFSIKSIVGLVVVSILSLAPVVLPKLFPEWFARFKTQRGPEA